MSFYESLQSPVTPILPVNGGATMLGVDTQLGGGQNPQQAGMSLAQLDAMTPVALVAVAGVYTPDLSLGKCFTIAAAANFTLAAPINAYAGQTFQIYITQDATGSRLMTANAVYKFPGGTKTLSTAAASVDAIKAQVLTNSAAVFNNGNLQAPTTPAAGTLVPSNLSLAYS